MSLGIYNYNYIFSPVIFPNFCLIVIDIDECLTDMDNCDDMSRATCSNTIGSFDCACNTGYAGDGTVCTGGVIIISTSAKTLLQIVEFLL